MPRPSQSERYARDEERKAVRSRDRVIGLAFLALVGLLTMGLFWLLS